jgi:Mrp family chromosome partitioning ATPase
MLLNRLRQDYGDDDTETSPSPKKTKPARSSRKRLRPTKTKEAATTSLKTAATKPASTGAEMSSLSSNDLRQYMTRRVASPDDDEATGVAPAPQNGGRFGPVLKSLDTVLDKVLALSAGGMPRALLVAGVSPDTDATRAAIGLARALVEQGEQVVLVDLTKGVSAVSGPLGLPRTPGFTDLATGHASFADVIRIDEDSPLQVITAGNPAAKGVGPEPDRFMPVFEALTEAYGCVVLHGDLRSVRKLMPALKFELPAMVAVLPDGASIASEKGALTNFQALGCPVLVYEEGGGKPRRMGLFSRAAAV